MRAILMPRRRRSETPIMSAKEKDLDSSPVGDQMSVPSVRTPSTSKAMASRVVSVVGSKGIRKVNSG